MTGTVADGCVDAALGKVSVDDLADGTAVDVLVRPEALRVRRVASGMATFPARVLASRILGRSSLIHLGITVPDGDDLHLHSRIPGRVLPAEHEIVDIDLDFDQAFVFPREGPD